VRAARSAGFCAGILVINGMRRLSAAEQRKIRRDDDDTDPLDDKGLIVPFDQLAIFRPSKIFLRAGEASDALKMPR